MAIRNRRPPRGLIHHSDRGVQCACGDYRKLLRLHGIGASMSRKGNCLDNAAHGKLLQLAQNRTRASNPLHRTTRGQSRTLRVDRDLLQSPTATLEHRLQNASASKHRHQRGKGCIDQHRPGPASESNVSFLAAVVSYRDVFGRKHGLMLKSKLSLEFLADGKLPFHNCADNNYSA